MPPAVVRWCSRPQPVVCPIGRLNFSRQKMCWPTRLPLSLCNLSIIITMQHAHSVDSFIFRTYRCNRNAEKKHQTSLTAAIAGLSLLCLRLPPVLLRSSRRSTRPLARRCALPPSRRSRRRRSTRRSTCAAASHAMNQLECTRADRVAPTHRSTTASDCTRVRRRRATPAATLTSHRAQG